MGAAGWFLLGAAVVILVIVVIYTSGKKGDEGGSDGGCFVPATRVRMAAGGSKPISDLKAGDQILTHEPDGRLQSTGVLKVESSPSSTVVEIKLSNGGTVAVSPRQPFIRHDGRSVQASEMASGTQLVSPSGVALVVVSATTKSYPGAVYCAKLATGKRLILHTGPQQAPSGTPSAKDIHDPVARAEKEGQMGQVEK